MQHSQGRIMFICLLIKSRLRILPLAISLICVLCLFLVSVHPIVAQDQPGPPTGYEFSKRPTNCEINIIRMEAVTKQAVQVITHEGVMIAIARLGDGERSREINRRRLHNIRVYLTSYQSFAPQKVITAEGEPASGHGRVELYLGGKLVDVLLVDRGKDLCVECCDGDERYYPYLKDKKRKR
jgi:hypothetical protein